MIYNEEHAWQNNISFADTHKVSDIALDKLLSQETFRLQTL